MILFNERPTFEEAWEATKFRVIMGGMGDDTAMMIAEMYERGYEPDEIVFCDTGSEFPHTYRFINFLQEWCAERKWSKVVVLKKFDKHGDPLSVIGMVEANNTLPAAAFGFKTCSMRFKTETGDKYFNNHPKAWEAWGVDRKGSRASSHTGSILRLVGINADEPDRTARWKPQDKWVQVFPLFDWGIGEKESDAVERVGLYYPGKSSCVCCPHLSSAELHMLHDDYPEIFERVQRIEDNYRKYDMKPDSTTIGLCRSKTIAQKMAQGYCSFEDQKCGECK
ncbi:MAG: hypothetical protein ACRCVE_01860 [Plesiomonas sp.]